MLGPDENELGSTFDRGGWFVAVKAMEWRSGALRALGGAVVASGAIAGCAPDSFESCTDTRTCGARDGSVDSAAGTSGAGAGGVGAGSSTGGSGPSGGSAGLAAGGVGGLGGQAGAGAAAGTAAVGGAGAGGSGAGGDAGRHDGGADAGGGGGGVVDAGAAGGPGGADAGADVPVDPCPGETDCGGLCADLESDAAHCGACNRACSPAGATSTRCVSGRCVPTCAFGQASCSDPDAPAADDGCEVSLNTDPDHCGACGFACSASGTSSRACSAGKCTPSCATGRADCSTPTRPSPDDGCEIVTTNNVNHCGACGHACSAAGVQTRRCVSSQCAPTCSAGLGDCSTPPASAQDDGCETPLASNPSHCGACGHSCLGGACASSACQAVQVATNQESADAITVDETTVYWVVNKAAGAVRARAKDLSAGMVTLAGSEEFPTDLVVAGGSLYWTSALAAQSYVRTLNASGNPTIFAGPYYNLSVWPIAADAGAIYYGIWNDGTIYKKNIPVGSATSIAMPPTSNPTSLAVDSTHVYWAGGKVQRTLVGGGAMPETLTTSGYQEYLALHGAYVYFTDLGGIYRKAKSGGPVQTLEAGTAKRLAADADGVFFASGTSVRWIALDGSGGSRLLWSTAGEALDVALDATAVYFTSKGVTTGTGVVYKIAKPLP